ncbi:hypothetical protein [Micromonospora sp. NPDC049240]|uniref:hypothetical protein n=1 Tax=Micromonospora sp. NPDC049240 TaxID=3155151 RepID=UPI00340C4FBA
MSINSEPRARGLQVTIKYGKGYEDTWVSFAGLRQEVFDDIVDYFGLDRDSVTGLTLSELVVSAANMAHAKGNVAGTLGGTVIPPAQQSKPAPASDVWDEIGQAGQSSSPAEPEEDPVLTLIKAAQSVDELKRIWAENQERVVGDALVAWKARGKELKAAGK